MNKLIVLEEANKKLNTMFDEFADERKLNTGTRKYIKSGIKKAYINKKIAYFMENRLSHINDYLKYAFDNVEEQLYGTNNNKNSVKLMFYKKIKRSYLYGKNI
jgi:hypothetical protein